MDLQEELWRVDYADIVFEDKIKLGEYGDVWRGRYLGEEVAVKELLNIDSEEHQKYLVSEIETFLNVSHPNIVRLLGVCIGKEGLFIITELAPTDLGELLEDTLKPLSWLQRVNYALDTARAMEYLHYKNIIHRDLNSSNLLISNDGKIKVCDFGFAKMLSKNQELLYSGLGTVDWRAPEISLGVPYDKSVDVFSFGVVLYEIISRKPPPVRHLYEQYRFVGERYKGSIPIDTPEGLWDLVCECTTFSPEARPSFSHVVAKLKSIKKRLKHLEKKAETKKKAPVEKQPEDSGETKKVIEQKLEDGGGETATRPKQCEEKGKSKLSKKKKTPKETEEAKGNVVNEKAIPATTKKKASSDGQKKVNPRLKGRSLEGTPLVKRGSSKTLEPIPEEEEAELGNIPQEVKSKKTKAGKTRDKRKPGIRAKGPYSGKQKSDESLSSSHSFHDGPDEESVPQTPPGRRKKVDPCLIKSATAVELHGQETSFSDISQEWSSTSNFYSIMGKGALGLLGEKRYSPSSEQMVSVGAEMSFFPQEKVSPITMARNTHMSLPSGKPSSARGVDKSKRRATTDTEDDEDDEDGVQTRIYEKSGKEIVDVTKKLRAWPFGPVGTCHFHCAIDKKPWSASSPVPINIIMNNETYRKIKTIQVQFNCIMPSGKSPKRRTLMSMEFTDQYIQTKEGSFPVKPFSRFEGEISFPLPPKKAASSLGSEEVTYEIVLCFPLSKRLEKGTLVKITLPIVLTEDP